MPIYQAQPSPQPEPQPQPQTGTRVPLPPRQAVQNEDELSHGRPRKALSRRSQFPSTPRFIFLSSARPGSSHHDQREPADEADDIDEHDNSEELDDGQDEPSTPDQNGPTAEFSRSTTTRQKRRRYHSVSPVRRVIARGDQDQITISSSSDSDKASEVEDSEVGSEDSLDVMPAPSSRFVRSHAVQPKSGRQDSRQAREDTTGISSRDAPAKSGGGKVSLMPAIQPRTPLSQAQGPRFRFATPTQQRPLGLHYTSSASPASAYRPLERRGYDAGNSQVEQSYTPNFVLPSAHLTDADSELNTSVGSIPLPEIFSPQKRGSKFVPGGLAETARNLILEAGGRMHLARTRQVQICSVKPLGANGALLAEVQETAPLPLPGPDSQHAPNGSDETSRGDQFNQQSKNQNNMKLMMLVGAEAHTAMGVQSGHVIGVRHGWHVPARIFNGLLGAKNNNNTPFDSLDRSVAATETSITTISNIEVCWGPV